MIRNRYNQIPHPTPDTSRERNKKASNTNYNYPQLKSKKISNDQELIQSEILPWNDQYKINGGRGAYTRVHNPALRIYTDRTLMPWDFSLHIALLIVTKNPLREFSLSLILTVSKLLLVILVLYFFLNNCECISSVSPSKTSKIFNVNKTCTFVGSRPVNQIFIRG